MRDSQLTYIFKSVIDSGVDKLLPDTDIKILRVVKAYGPRITELKSKILSDQTAFRISQHYMRDVNIRTFYASEIYRNQDQNKGQPLLVYEHFLSRRVEAGLSTPRRMLVIDENNSVHDITSSFDLVEDACMISDLSVDLM